MLEIYSQDNELKAVIEPASNATQTEGVMQISMLNLSFVLADYVRLDVNDYIDFLNKRYTLFDDYRPEHVSNQEYKYDVKFYGPEKWLERALVLKLVDGEDEPIFALTDTARTHLQLYADNLNRITGTDVWTVGEVIETENITIEYTNKNCFAGITELAEKAGTEYWVEGYTLNLSRCEHGEQLVLGYNQGLQNLSKDKNEKAPFFTRLFPIGSSRNIDRESYGAPRLQLPGGVKYVEHNIHYGVFERSEESAFSHIYPRRIGQVGKVRSEVRTIDGKEVTIYYFTDPGLTFDPNDYEIAGLVKHIKFEGGPLNGNDFEANFHSDTGEFELITQFPYENIQLPGGSMIPEPGDEYILYNLKMPDEYYTLAEQEYLEAVEDYIEKYSIDTAVYKGKTDYIDLDKRGVVLVPGRRTLLVSPKYFNEGSRPSRITAISRNLLLPNDANIECSYAVTPSRIAAIESVVVQIQAAVNEQADRNDMQILKSWDNADSTEYNVFSSLRALREIARRAISKVQADVALGFVKFMAGIQAKKVEIGEFISGMIGGRGAALTVDEATGKSMLEIDRIHAREELIVPKITFNCIDVISGDKANTFAFGTFKSVDTKNRIAELDLLDDQLGTLKVNDICRGIFHNLTGGNQTEDGSDDNGFLNYAGFSTAYFTPTEILVNEPGVFRFRYALQPDTTVHPSVGMNFYAYGNFTDATRQAMTYENRYYTRRLKGVNTWTIDPSKNISMQVGLLEGETIGGLTMHGYGSYLENVYMTGTHIQFTPEEIEKLQGKSAYNVSLSTYEKVVKMDADGNLADMYEEFNVTAGGENVITGDKNVVASVYSLSTYVQAWKGDQELLFADAVDKGRYVVVVSAIGCTAAVSGGVLTITGITNPDNCFVDLKVNCEGNAVFDKRFSVVVVADGADGKDGEGKDGRYTELRYRDAIDRPATPAGINPAGWSLSPDPGNVALTQSGDFALIDQVYTSPTPPRNGTTYKQRVSFTTLADNQVLSLKIEMASELYYDMGAVTKLDTAYTAGSFQWSKTGYVSEVVEIAVPTAGSHFVEIVFAKNGLYNSDRFWMKYRFIQPRRRWLSTAVIDPNTNTASPWSIPVEFPMDTPSEEQIYLLAKSEITANLPASDLYLDEYIGDALGYSETVEYTPGRIVKYGGGYRVCTTAATGIAPDDDEYWDDARWWTDNPSGASAEWPYEYVCVREFTNGVWGAYGKYRLFMRYAQDGVTPVVTRLIPSVTQVGRTMTGSFEPGAFSVAHKDTAGVPVAAFMAVWGSRDGSTYTRIGAVEKVSVKNVNVEQYPYQYFVIRTYASADVTWESEYLLSTSVSVVSDGATGAMPVYCGFFDAGQEYTYTNTTRDIINYEIDGAVYTFQVKVHGSTVTAAPTSPTGDENWEPASKFRFIAMDTALIDGANIAGFMYKNLLMISRLGKLDGVEIDIKDVPDGRLNDFQPNIQMDGRTGEAIFNKTLIRGGISEPFELYASVAELQAGMSYNWHVVNYSVLNGSIIGAVEKHEGRTLRIFNNCGTALSFRLAAIIPPISTTPGSKNIYLPNGAVLEAKCIKFNISGEEVFSWLVMSRFSYNASSSLVTVKYLNE